MRRKTDHNFFSELMTHANMGWWEADLENESYICSKYIADLLNLEEDGVISFKEFNRHILKEEQRHTTVQSFDNIRQTPEAVYLLETVKGPTWIRSKICFQETDENGKTKIYGIAETQDRPYMASAYQALQKNERILYNIYKRLPVGIELYTIDGVLIDLNDKEVEMFHLNQREDLLGINIFENPNFPEEMKKKLKRYEEADFTFNYDFSKINGYYPTRKKEGRINLVTKVTTLYDENRIPVNYLLINADRTETTVAYHKIREFETLFELVGDYAKVGYAVYNLISEKGYAQESWYRNIGEQKETPMREVIGIYEHVHPTDRVIINQFLENAKKGTAHEISKEVRVLREDGSYTWTHVNLLVGNYEPESNIIEIISINYDITNMKRTEEMLIKARKKAEGSDRLKSAFLANISHEIRTPLNAIVGFSNLLVGTDDTKEKEEYCSLISRNNELLLKLINDILYISKIESGHLESHPYWFNLPELIDICVAEYREQALPQVELRIKQPPKDHLVELDRILVKQVLNNLLSNAVKNTVEGFIEVSYEASAEGIEICVTDTGSGIPQDKLNKIFERFEKLDSFAQGVGLGLSISQSVVEAMHGQISVDSEIDKGSTFRIKLPCKVTTPEKLV